MCGIAGIWNLNDQPLELAVLEKFTDSIAHRGPDGFGYYIDPAASLGLGHRRLSIIDLSENGKQPMSFADERYWISYNGEVFNFIELQTELEAKGYVFKSSSDTEVILGAYHCWGKDCLNKFNGMWGLAIWDKQEQTLFLARDRFGIKPLYYLSLPGKVFAFSSETISFKHLEGIPRQLNHDRLSRVILDSSSLAGYGYTIFENVNQLLPGHYLMLRKGQQPVQKRWWSTAEHLFVPPESYQEQVACFRDLFENACRIRMRSDVPLATALSGGVDSSAVNCMMYHLMQGETDISRIPANWQHAFVSYFKDTNQDEKRFADEVIRYTGGKATFLETDYLKMIQDVEKSTVAFDDIIGSPLVVIADLYGGMRKAGIKVSLDGHGVDEMLFGYPYMVREAYNWAQQHKKQLTGDLRNTYLGLFDEEMVFEAGLELDKQGLVAPSSFSRRIAQRLPDFITRFVRGKRVLPVRFSPYLRYPVSGFLPELSDKPENLNKLNALDRSVYHGFHSGMLPGILRNFDRASMQHQVEIRMPFMDWRLVTFVFSLPLESKLQGGFTKRILRDSMKGLMPEDIRTRKLKIGFSAPLEAWFKNDMKEFVLDKISSKKFQESELWNGPLLKEKALKNYANDTWTWKECANLWMFISADLIC